MLQLLTTNLHGKVRRQTLNGRQYYVVPLTMIVPGVLNGSQGPLYYPPEEIANNYQAWNGMPIVVNHPRDPVTNAPVSARRPDIAEQYQIGTVYNATVTEEGKLIAEGWFDIALTKKIDRRVLNTIESGNSGELSTGLFTANEPHQGEYNGKPFTHIARNYRPDHLAILPDTTGACSVHDGCGVLVNDEDMGYGDKKKKKKGCKCGGKCSKCKMMHNRLNRFLVNSKPPSTPLEKFIVNAKKGGGNNCGIGPGGFQPGNKCASGGAGGSGGSEAFSPGQRVNYVSSNETLHGVVDSVKGDTIKVRVPGRGVLKLSLENDIITKAKEHKPQTDPFADLMKKAKAEKGKVEPKRDLTPGTKRSGPEWTPAQLAAQAKRFRKR